MLGEVMNYQKHTFIYFYSLKEIEYVTKTTHLKQTGSIYL